MIFGIFSSRSDLMILRAVPVPRGPRLAVPAVWGGSYPLLPSVCGGWVLPSQEEGGGLRGPLLPCRWGPYPDPTSVPAPGQGSPCPLPSQPTSTSGTAGAGRAFLRVRAREKRPACRGSGAGGPGKPVPGFGGVWEGGCSGGWMLRGWLCPCSPGRGKCSPRGTSVRGD